MRILHTSDWHLGALFHDQLREADERHALDQLVGLCRAEEVDVVLVAGDIFDTANPSAEAQQRYYQTLVRMVSEGGVGSVVVIAGNHDNGLRLDGPRELLASLRLHVRGLFARDAEPGSCVVDVFDRRGQRAGVCAAVPYLREGDLRMPELSEAAYEIAVRQGEALRLRFAQINEAAQLRADGLPLLVMTHCFAANGAPSDDERPVYAQVGKLSQTRIEALAKGASYAALGHLHRPQIVAGNAHWRYSGSLLANGFDQSSIARSVVIADVSTAGVPAVVRTHALVPYRRYARIEGTPEVVEAKIAALAPKTDGEPDPWLQVTVVLSEPRPGIAAQTVEWAAARGWTALSIRPSRLLEPNVSFSAGDEISGLGELAPETVFVKMHEYEYDAPPDASLTEAFAALLHEVQGAAV